MLARMILGALLLAALPANAGGWEPINAQKLIDSCWAISEEARGGTNSAMIAGTERTVRCLEDAVLIQANDFEFSMGVEKYLDQLHALRGALDQLYFPAFFESPKCGKSCYPGSVTPLHLQWEYAKDLERLLHTLVRERNELEF